MDERTLQVIIKAQNDTKAAFAEVMAAMEAMKRLAGDGGEGGGGSSGTQSLSGALSATTAAFGRMWAMLPQIGIGFAILGAVAISPLIVAFGALIANTVAWTAMAAVAIPVIGGLTFAIFQLGAANVGGLSPAGEMVKLHSALATAIKNHSTALDELKAAQAGVDVYGLGKGTKAENVFLASQYVSATASVVADTQHDIREPARGIGGPIAGLGTAIDDMKHHFETASRAMAEHIAVWAGQFLPNIQRAGDAIEKWFGDRLPGILNFLTPVIKSLGGFFGDIGREVGKVIDYVIAHQSEFMGFFQGLEKFLSGTFKGVMDSMMNVADWFQKNWPGISKAAGDAAKNIGEGFSPWLPVVKQALSDIGDKLKFIGDHAAQLKPLQEVFGFLAGGVIVTVTSTLNQFLSVLSGILWVIQQLEGSANRMNAPRGPSTHSIIGPHGVPIPVPGAVLGSPNVHGIIGL